MQIHIAVSDGGKTQIIDSNVRCFLNGAVENASRKRGKGGRGIKESTTSRSRARSVRSAQIALRVSAECLDRPSLIAYASRGGLAESLASLGSVHGGSRGGLRPGTSTGYGRSGSRLTAASGRRGDVLDDTDRPVATILKFT